jgi:flagellar motility protein MotE (MotC chaperone)
MQRPTRESEDKAMIIKRARIGIYLLVCCLVLNPATGIAADQTTADDSPEDSADLDQVKREWAETVDALKHYSAAQRDAAVDRAEQTLDAMDRRIEQLEARTRQQWGKLTQSAREAREATLQRLRMQRNQAAEWYGGMKHSSAGAWESVKQGFIDSYAVLSDSFRKARDEFGDDEAPPGRPRAEP